MILTCHWDYSFNVGPPVPKAGYFYFGNKKSTRRGVLRCVLLRGGDNVGPSVSGPAVYSCVGFHLYAWRNPRLSASWTVETYKSPFLGVIKIESYR